ncbi:hypothetical protein ATEG_03583 [Aspergillus terreus NIH2624]|uniref:Uncharacterized protein n=1 Tax=Aspergillus terreus (strain NIH 2624 / FGSC A1156) TaxID=341663 RepID=Q0CRV1_ASPTN|nr:uncharacterized protein ATEG_03583 [Aspergillus terreus NIH2624]EAU35385.1 hypothetical protein ATEG_03583 [Aspergillus terreus NIH2624]
MRFSIWIVLTLFTNTHALLASSDLKRQNECTAATTDELIFKTDIEAFSAAREAREPPCFDWSSDDCTMAPDMPAGFNFEPSCRRHDFGYRNFGAQDSTRKQLYDILGKHCLLEYLLTRQQQDVRLYQAYPSPKNKPETDVDIITIYSLDTESPDI